MKINRFLKGSSLICTLVLTAGLLSACGNNKETESVKPSVNGNTVNESVADIDTDAKTLTFGLTPFEKPEKLRIAYLAGAVNPYIIAEKLGVFDELNIDVEFICFSGGPAEMEANSEWDIATAGAGGLCIGATAYDMHIIDIMNYEEHHSLWARKDSALAKDPTNPENWKVEWVYASGTTCQAVLSAGLESVGLTIDDISSVNVDLATTYTAFNSGTGTAASTSPFQSTYAEADGYVLIGTDVDFGYETISGTVASKKTLDNKMDLVTTAVAVAHLTNDWMYESEDNKAQVAQWFFENCEEEGYKCTEDSAEKLTQWYHGPTTKDWINSYTEASSDKAGLYSKRDLLLSEHSFLNTLDFFIGEGKYSADDRAYVLDNSMIDPAVAAAAKELLDNAGIDY